MTDAPEFPAESAEPAAAAPAAPAPVTDPFAVPSGVAPEAAAPAEPEADVEPVVAEEAVAEHAAEEAAPEEVAPVEEAPVAESAEEPAEELVETAEDSKADSGADESGADEELDPAEELRLALRLKPGEWYVVHSYAGYENRVKSNIESRTTSLNMEDYIFQVEVPTEDVVEIKNNQRKNVKRQKFPGYVLVRMELTDGSWSAVRNTPGVTGFVGHGHQPTPLTLDEVVAILAPAEEKKTAAGGGAVTEVRVLDFEVGDSVTITGEHAFAGLLATIHEVNPDSRRVKAFVEIFGRETPVELEFSNIQKN